MAWLDELERAAGLVGIVERVVADGVSRFVNHYTNNFTSDPRKRAVFIEAAELYLSSHCGIRHLASATTEMIIGLFGSTDPSSYAAFDPNDVAIRRARVAVDAVAHRVAAHILRTARVTGEPP